MKYKLNELIAEMQSPIESLNKNEIIKQAFYYLVKLQESLQWYIDEDEVNEGMESNRYWIDGKYKAMKLLED